MNITRETKGIIWGLEWEPPLRIQRNNSFPKGMIVGEGKDAILGATYRLYISELSSEVQFN